ncbi:restriction endonuclease subunit S [Micromonospora schwarzwaldensis]|uniref:restriction endonuclease subunit S n=1 Tax=Micromonospora sp. DSM 45708 TaxID=3111767 RepID=UPI0031CFFD16
MSLNLDKSGWKRVALGDVIRHVTDRVDPETSGLERFLAGEHIPSNSLHITDWGVIGRDPIGPMFYKRFRPGHVLYVSRRSYLRKTAVPDFEGITGEKTFVLETCDPSILLQEFMPFLLSSELFHFYAVANSRGSVNPYINWTDLANYQFDLPPIHEQERIAAILWMTEDAVRVARHVKNCATAAVRELGSSLLSRFEWRASLGDVLTGIAAGRSLPGSSAPARDGKYGVLKVSAIGEEGFIAAENKELLDQRGFSSECQIFGGDLLVTRANTSAYVGRSCIVPADHPNLMLSDKTLRLDVREAVVTRSFVYEYLQVPRTRAEIASVATGTGAAMKNISQKDVRRLAFPAIPLTDQARFLEKMAQARAAVVCAQRDVDNARELQARLLQEVCQ